MPPPAPPPEEDKPLPLPLPLPRPKPEPEAEPPKPKPKGPEPMPKPAGPLPERDGDSGGVATSPPDFLCRDTCSGPCVYLPRCQPQPPQSRGATVHLRSSRLPTPLIALSASLLTVSAVLLLALLVHRVVQRRRRRRRARDAAAHHGEEGGGGGHGHQVLAGAVAQEVGQEEEADGGGGGVHHVWYIRTKGLDERAIAAIAAVVYDAKKRGAIGLGGGGGGKDGDGDDGDDDGSCAVCLAEFRDGETLRLLPRCGHAFHRGCIDTWLRAHVNCPLCRAPVQVALAGAGANNPNAAAPAAPTATSGRREQRNNLVGTVGGVQTEETARGDGGGGVTDRGVRRAASMVALPRRAWPDVSVPAPASSSGREEDMTGLGKIRRFLKFSDAMEMTGIGVERSVSFGAGSWQRLQPRSGPSAAAAAAAGVSADEMSQ